MLLRQGLIAFCALRLLPWLTKAFIGQELGKIGHLPDIAGLCSMNAIDIDAGNVATKDLHNPKDNIGQCGQERTAASRPMSRRSRKMD